MATSALETPYRIKARLSGDLSRANLLLDVAALQQELGECATADSSHGAEHAPLVLFGERAAYFSIVGVQTCARAAVARCALGGRLSGTLNPKRQWELMESTQRSGKSSSKPAAFGFKGVTTATGDYHSSLGRITAAAAGAPAASPPPLILCGVTGPSNVGSILRLMACLGFEELRRISAGEVSQLIAGDESGKAALRATAKGCEVHTRCHPPQSLTDYVEHLRAHGPGERLPIVAVETATGALNMHSFMWPRECQIMVGGESCGIPSPIIAHLRPGFDSLVVIPMPGPHKSLNVAAAMGMALFSYRGCWPG